MRGTFRFTIHNIYVLVLTLININHQPQRMARYRIDTTKYQLQSTNTFHSTPV